MNTLVFIINIALGIGITYVQLTYYLWLKKNNINSWRWLKLTYSLVGLLWVALFTLLLLDDIGTPFCMGKIMTQYFLPVITLTLGTILSGGIISLKRLR